MTGQNLGKIERGLVPLGEEHHGPLARALEIEPVDLFRSPKGISTAPLSSRVSADTRGLQFRGDIRAGAWLETGDTDQREPEIYPASPDPRFPRAAQWLRRVTGDSMNALTKGGLPAGILDGDVVHVVDAIATDYKPQTGDVVEVERSRFQGAEREITLKQVEALGRRKFLLWPRSTNPRWKDPINYVEGVGAGEEIEVRVVGKVLQVLRQF